MCCRPDLAASGDADGTLAQGSDVRLRLPTKSEYVGRARL